ncbi:MAG: methyltransferase [Deltaproteobacteria bacterium]|nr:methyltransferase [Deltaproteobacteria bacterium]
MKNKALDPVKLLRYRDSIYASDLLICSVAYFDFFSFFKNTPRTFTEICEHFKIVSRPADVMLSLFLAMKLINKTKTAYLLSDVSMEYLVDSSPESLVPYYASLKNRPQCIEFRDILLSGKPAGWSSRNDGSDWIKAMQDTGFANSFISAMDSRGSFLAKMLARKIDLSCHRSILDIAGGSGVYACALNKRHKHLAAAVLEIPPADGAARRSVEAKGMSDKVHIIGGDMFNQIPKGYDVHLFANVFHDWDIDSVETLVANSFESLCPGGSILIFDAHLNAEKNGPLPVAEYSCLLMHSTEGKCYSTKEILEILRKVGFIKPEILGIAAYRTLIIGNKPAVGVVRFDGHPGLNGKSGDGLFK